MTISVRVSCNGNYKCPVSYKQGDREESFTLSGRGKDGPDERHIPFYHGADARKALAAELPALKAACAEDVPFDGAQPEAAAQTTLAEQLGLDDSPSQAKANEIARSLETATDEATVDAASAEFEKHRSALDETQQMALEVAVSKARERAKGKAKEGVE